jgi:hypothetical protein
MEYRYFENVSSAETPRYTGNLCSTRRSKKKHDRSRFTVENLTTRKREMFVL